MRARGAAAAANWAELAPDPHRTAWKSFHATPAVLLSLGAQLAGRPAATDVIAAAKKHVEEHGALHVGAAVSVGLDPAGGAWILDHAVWESLRAAPSDVALWVNYIAVDGHVGALSAPPRQLF